MPWWIKRYLWLPILYQFRDAKDAWEVFRGRASIESGWWYAGKKDEKRRRT